jgi:hypothetical protein
MINPKCLIDVAELLGLKISLNNVWFIWKQIWVFNVFFFLKKLTLHEDEGLIWCDFIDLEYLNIIWMTDTNIIWLKKLK